jgi:phage terminase small subunit
VSTIASTPQERYAVALAELSPQRRKFVAEYLVDLRQRDAAIRAGYSAKSADAQASQLLKNPKVFEAIQAGIDLYAMPEPEILLRLSRIARGSIADVLRLPPTSYEEAAATLAADGSTPLPTAIDSWALDLVKAQQTGAIHLVKKLKEGEHGPEVELHSAHEALRDLAKIRGMTVDRAETRHEGGLTIRVEYADADPDLAETP